MHSKLKIVLFYNERKILIVCGGFPHTDQGYSKPSKTTFILLSTFDLRHHQKNNNCLYIYKRINKELNTTHYNFKLHTIQTFTHRLLHFIQTCTYRILKFLNLSLDIRSVLYLFPWTLFLETHFVLRKHSMEASWLL